MSAVIVHVGLTNTLEVDVGVDVSADTLTSEIRTLPKRDGTLIATWNLVKTTDGTDGLLTLTLDNTITEQIVAAEGWMDIRRVVGGEPVPLFDQPLRVEFRGTVTN